MNHKIKVSVIIPVYQVENYLERAVDSALAQTLEEKEIILVDDGSEDTSPQICDQYEKAYPELIRVIHKKNEGLGLARNTGVRAASGEYIAFLDSDDTVEPEMYEEMYEKASAENLDIVMCDVKIIYVEENKTSVVSSYPKENFDLADYIANGSNITYSVNKLFRRSIWEENSYKKMLFEDIALIPSLVTRYHRIGYVKKPFYHYYRRANTLSTTFSGNMTDIIEAFRSFLDTSDPYYHEEVVYCTARQLYWNMTQSRVLFQADFIEFLKEYKKDFLLNSYLAKDKQLHPLLDFLKKEVIPDNIICVHFARAIPQEYLDAVAQCFPRAKLITADETYCPLDQLPDNVREAIDAGRLGYAEEYVSLKLLFEQGGIVVTPDCIPSLNLKKLRLNQIFFGFEDPDQITSGCYGALPNHYVVEALLETYEQDNIFNKAFLPLKERIRDFLIIHFQLQANGKKQLLHGEIPVYLPSVLAYDMHDGENCCKKSEFPIPQGYELVSGAVLKMWSDRLLENWNLYKRELQAKHPSARTAARTDSGMLSQELFERELERQLQAVVDAYETSTCWKITKPLRAIAKIFGK